MKFFTPLPISPMIFQFFVLLAFSPFSFGNISSPSPNEIYVKLKGMIFNSESLHTNFHLLYKLYSIIESYKGKRMLYGELYSAHFNATSSYHNLVKNLYMQDREGFITQTADSNPFILGFYFYCERTWVSTSYFSCLNRKEDGFKDFASVSFGYINDFIWDQLKSPISDLNPWSDRLELIKAHIGFLKKVQRICHPVDEVFLTFSRITNIYSKKSSMRLLLETYDFLMEGFKFDEAKIDHFDFEQVLWKIVSLSRNINGKFVLEKVGSLIDLGRLYSNHFMDTLNDENFLITINPKILSLCTISYCELDNEVLFCYFRLSTQSLIKMALVFVSRRFLPPNRPNETVQANASCDKDEWQTKIYSRLKYLEKVYQNNSQ
jgi:hypothetical protein